MTKEEFTAEMMRQGCTEQESEQLWANGFRTVRIATLRMKFLNLSATRKAAPKLQRDPAGRTCPQCTEELNESIPLDANGTCHSCGSCYGKVQP